MVWFLFLFFLVCFFLWSQVSPRAFQKLTTCHPDEFSWRFGDHVNHLVGCTFTPPWCALMKDSRFYTAFRNLEQIFLSGDGLCANLLTDLLRFYEWDPVTVHSTRREKSTQSSNFAWITNNQQWLDGVFRALWLPQSDFGLFFFLNVRHCLLSVCKENFR